MISRALNSFSNHLVPESLRQDPEVYRRAKWVAAFDAAFIFWTVMFAGLYGALASTRCGMVTLLAVLPMLQSLAALKRGKSPAMCGNLLCFGGWISLTALAGITGGSSAPALFWYTCLPFVAILTAGVRWGIFWTVISFGTLLCFAIAESLGIRLPNDVPAENTKTLYFSVLSGLVVCHFVLASLRVGIEQRARDALEDANRRLSQARQTLETLEKSFDFSIEEWERVKRERRAREFVEKVLNSDDEFVGGELEEIDGDSSDTDLPATSRRA
jgi:hypothetical protein